MKQINQFLDPFLLYCISSINIAFLISTPESPVQYSYYLNTNIEMVVIFVNSALSNSSYHMSLCDSRYYSFSKLLCNNGIVTSIYKLYQATSRREVIAMYIYSVVYTYSKQVVRYNAYLYFMPKDNLT